MAYYQMEFFENSTHHQLKNLRAWSRRLERRITEMEFRQELIDHAKKTGFETKTEKPVQFDLFGT